MYNIKEIAKLIKGEIKGNDNLSFLRLSPFFHTGKLSSQVQHLI